VDASNREGKKGGHEEEVLDLHSANGAGKFKGTSTYFLVETDGGRQKGNTPKKAIRLGKEGIYYSILIFAKQSLRSAIVAAEKEREMGGKEKKSEAQDGGSGSPGWAASARSPQHVLGEQPAKGESRPRVKGLLVRSGTLKGLSRSVISRG